MAAKTLAESPRTLLNVSTGFQLSSTANTATVKKTKSFCEKVLVFSRLLGDRSCTLGCNRKSDHSWWCKVKIFFRPDSLILVWPSQSRTEMRGHTFIDHAPPNCCTAYVSLYSTLYHSFQFQPMHGCAGKQALSHFFCQLTGSQTEISPLFQLHETCRSLAVISTETYCQREPVIKLQPGLNPLPWPGARVSIGFSACALNVQTVVSWAVRMEVRLQQTEHTH